MAVRYVLVCDWCGAESDAKPRGEGVPTEWKEFGHELVCPECVHALDVAKSSRRALRLATQPTTPAPGQR